MNRQFISIFFVLVSFLSQANDNIPRALNGKIDLKDWDFEADGVLALDGEWQFDWEKFIDPKTTKSNIFDSHFFPVPALWNQEKMFAAQGYGTYRLKIVGDLKDKKLGLKIPAVYSNYKLWVNGNLFTANGIPGSTKETSKPKWLPISKSFDSTSDEINITMHVSNFHHTKGGTIDNIMLGSADQLENDRRLATWVNLLSIIGLFVLGIISLSIFYFMKRQKALVYIGVFCLLWSLRGLFTDLYMMICWFPDFDWALAVKMEYLTMYFGLAMGALFMLENYRKEASETAIRIMVVGSLLFATVTLVTQPIFFTSLLPAFWAFTTFVMMYFIYVMVNAIRNGNVGVWFLRTSMFLIILLILYNVLAVQNLLNLNPLILNLGYLAFFAANIISYIITIFKPDEELKSNLNSVKSGT